MEVPRIILAGVTSGVGKTSVALGVMHGLRSKGLIVQPFKVGPDFIDPSYHGMITNRNSHNLDVWLMGNSGLLRCFTNACQDADIAVVEGVMGLYDGMSGKNNFASTAHVAKILDSPVVLIVDASKGARSIAAIILGFLKFDRKLRIAAVILNKVAGERHARYITDAIGDKVKIPVVGVVYRNPEIEMVERHLGLIPAVELDRAKTQKISKTAQYSAECIDIDRIVSLSGRTPLPPALPRPPKKLSARVKIGIALDESFNFYYFENLISLEMSGAQLVYFSPVKDKNLPDGLDGLILGGGFPEVLADKLESNESMRDSIKQAVDHGMPVYGECGGLMYLTRSISGYNDGANTARRMVGVIDADTQMTGKLTLNYTEAECNGPIFGKTQLRGHEFHYSSIQNIASDTRFAYNLKKGTGIRDNRDGFVINENGLAAYMHLHFANRKLSERIVRSSLKFSRR